MRRFAVSALAAGLLVVSAAACGLGDIAGVSFRLGGPDEYPLLQVDESVPFTAEGWHVDRENLCGGGTVTIARFETMDGATITNEEWNATFETARSIEGVAEAYLFQDFECEDGSGAFSMKVHVEYDFATFEFAEEQDIGTWEIEEGKGTGSYSDISGSGGVALDWDEDGAWYGGDINP